MDAKVGVGGLLAAAVTLNDGLQFEPGFFDGRRNSSGQKVSPRGTAERRAAKKAAKKAKRRNRR